MLKLLYRLGISLGLLPDRRAYARPNTCHRLSYLARTSHY